MIFKLILTIDGYGISREICLRVWLLLDLSDDKSTLVQVMAWCRQATSHYLSHCWPKPMSSYGVNGPQWVRAQNTKVNIAFTFIIISFNVSFWTLWNAINIVNTECVQVFLNILLKNVKINLIYLESRDRHLKGVYMMGWPPAWFL